MRAVYPCAVPQIHRVSEITTAIRRSLESTFHDVIVEGEVSNFRPASSGHWYFSLKDESSLLSCVMFRGSRRGVVHDLQDGDSIRAYGDISVYPPRGSYQLVLRSFEYAGAGQILAMLEERKRAFDAAGLFANSRPLPYLPRTVAVVTSPTGAAIRDIVRVLSRRRSPVTLRIVPVPVQGSESHEKISAAIRYAGRHQLGDVILVTRGGGSIEDLLPFSEKSVIEAIAASPVPVISAVGHEIDWALADFAADLRAPTPSAAAEVVAPSYDDIRSRLRTALEGGIQSFLSRIRSVRYRVDRFSVQEIRYRFRNFTAPWYQRLDDARAACEEGVRRIVSDRRTRLELMRERIDGASPYRALSRGYTIVRAHSTGEIIPRRAGAAGIARVDVQFDDGILELRRAEQEEQ